MAIKEGGWVLQSWDPASGRSVWRYDDGQAVHYRTDYPMDGILRDNTAHRNDSAGQRFGEGKRVASIPLNIFYDQLEEAHSQGDDKYLSKWLNDSDNRGFRTFEGAV